MLTISLSSSFTYLTLLINMILSFIMLRFPSYPLLPEILTRHDDIEVSDEMMDDRICNNNSSGAVECR